MSSAVLRDPSRLQALRSTGLLEPEPDEALDRLTRLAVRALAAPVAFVTLLDGERQVFKSMAAPPALRAIRETPFAQSFCRHAVASAEPFVVEDAREHPLIRDIPAVLDLELVAYLGVPLLSGEGYALGAFCVVDHGPRVWGQGELDLITDLAAAAVSEIELRHATGQAQLGERRLAQAQALAGIGTWEWEVGSGRVCWSERVYEIMGLDPEDSPAGHEDFMQHVHPDDREHVEQSIQAALAGERPWYEYECRIHRPDGSRRTISVRADVEYGDGGLPRRSTGIVRDITEERESERELADTARRLAEAQAIARMGSWEWTAREGTKWSDELFRILGREPGTAPEHEEVLARVVHPDDREHMDRVTMEAHNGDARSYEVSFRIVRPDGELRWIEARGDITRDRSGVALRSTGIAHDVTEAHVAASRLAEAEALARFGSWEWDLRDGATVWSPPLYEMFGEDPSGRPLDYAGILARVHPEDRARTAAEIESAMAGSRSFDVTARILRSPEDTRWVRARGEMIRDDRGQLVRMLGTIQDITDARRADALLREAEERFGTAFESTSSGMALVDLEMRRFLRVNSAMCAGLRRSKEEVLAMDPMALLHPDDAELDERAVDALLAGSRPSLEFERRFVVAGGEVRIALVHLAMVRDAEERPLYLVCHSRDMTDQRRAEEQVRFQALHHPLTGLPNRSLFLDRLRQALLQAERRGSTVAVMAIDIDRFRAINERFGLDAGDHVLKSVGPRLAQGLRESDTVAHLGEDLFAVICEDLVDEHEALALAARLQRAVGRRMEVEGEAVRLTASIGVALAAAGEGCPDDLVRDAESAAVGARKRGGGRWEVFDPALRSRLVDRMELEHELRTGIEQGQLRLHYQPVTAWDAQTLVGYEALVRWEHPGRGLLYPASFLPTAEETGLDVPLGSFVLREACRQVVAWSDEDAAWEPVGVGVNVSARQLDQPGFVEEVAQVLAETGIRADRLRLELTETDLMRSADPVGTIERLKALGVQVILDDFGTGYSSLSHLRSFPVDGLKIDRSFVGDIATDVRSAQIVDAIVAMADALGLTVVAEGVETEEQLASLRALDCHMLQGFLLGRPVAPGDIRRDWSLPDR